jgi:hypothetical protein
MSKPYKVDTWIGPFEDFPEGTEIHTRELEHELVCSDDEKRAYVKEGDEWVLFEIVEKAASNPPGDKIEFAYLDKVSSETDAKAFIEGRLKKHAPGPAQHYTANHCHSAEKIDPS